MLRRRFLLACLITGLLARGVILWSTSTLGTTIVDEQQYSQIADNILAGNGFAWGPGAPTSIRPPVYPSLLSAVWAATGPRNLQAVRALQIVLALAACAVVYLIGKRLYDPVAGEIAAAICWLYPSFLFVNFLVLTETLFTLLLLTFVLLTIALVQRPRLTTAFVCGAVLAVTALTRSSLWPLPLVLCPLLAFLIQGKASRRVLVPVLLLAGYVAVIAPWALRNTRLQETLTIVDTMGGINLRMGNYEFTPDDRMWDAVAITGERSWVHGFTTDPPGLPATEGRKEKWAQRKAVEYMVAHPIVTARRSLIKFADFWGLEREFAAGVQARLFAPPRWAAILGTIVILLGYVAVVTMGASGIWLAPPADWRLHVVVLLPVLVTMGAHTLVFGHARYHLPLMPIFGIYAAALITRFDPSVVRRVAPSTLGALASVAILATIWVRQIVFVDLGRITSLLKMFG